MARSRPGSKAKANPVETAIFLVIALIFANSIYHLGKGSQTNAQESTSRIPASLSLPILSSAIRNSPDRVIDFGCESNADVTASEDRLRFRGQLCGHLPTSRENLRRLVRAEVVNQANRSKALVYADSRSGSFESSSVELSQGDNPIFVKFVYTGGKVVSQKMTVRRP